MSNRAGGGRAANCRAYRATTFIFLQALLSPALPRMPSISLEETSFGSRRVVGARALKGVVADGS